jgi:hypothetical protein
MTWKTLEEIIRRGRNRSVKAYRVTDDDDADEQKLCFHFRYNFCLKQLSFQEQLSEMLQEMYIGLRV